MNETMVGFALRTERRRRARGPQRTRPQACARAYRRGAPAGTFTLFLLIAAACAPVALADNVCDPGEAPDVITGDIVGAQRYGTVGDITAYAIGTTSCNVGTCQANWISNTADHPLIAQNLFRPEEWPLRAGGPGLAQACLRRPSGEHLLELLPRPPTALTWA
jgi:hypothetical protein